MPSFLKVCKWPRGRVATIVGQVIGAPDYERYLTHVRVNHPGSRPLERDDFYRASLEARYSKPGSRCC
jgi:uncharacterized short protein YbdD (DUF466 family)